MREPRIHIGPPRVEPAACGTRADQRRVEIGRDHRIVPCALRDDQSVLAAVAAGVGVVFVPSRAEYLLRDAKVLRLKDASAQWRVGIAWQTERDDPVVTRFVDYVRATTKHKA